MNKPLWFFSVLTVIAIAAGLLLRSKFFNIHSVRVNTVSAPLRMSIETELQSLMGSSLWELESEDLANTLLEKYKLIHSLSFKKNWPDTLIVEIEERKALALIFVEQELWAIDKEGVPFVESAEALPLFWPIPPDKKKFKEILSWLETVRPTEVNGLTWDRELGLLVFADKTPVRRAKIVLGRHNFAENWRKAQESIEFLNSRGIQARKIDATYNKRAVVSL